MNKTQIQLPPIEVWQSDKGLGWCWQAPNGARGTHEASARAAAVTALSGMRIDPKTVTLPDK